MYFTPAEDRDVFVIHNSVHLYTWGDIHGSEVKNSVMVRLHGYLDSSMHLF